MIIKQEYPITYVVETIAKAKLLNVRKYPPTLRLAISALASLSVNDLHEAGMPIIYRAIEILEENRVL